MSSQFNLTPPPPPGYQMAAAAPPHATLMVSPKSRSVAAVLAIFLGPFGVHRFYVGKAGTGVLMFLTMGGFMLWYFVDIVLILSGQFRDKHARLLADW